jgi:uncharacterized protein (DUF433 family)
MTRPFSVRMDDRTHDELLAHAKRAEASPSRLVNRYVKEGLRMDAHPAITFRTTSLGRRATVLAARPGLQVIDVIGTWREEGQDIAATARYLDISQDEVRAVLRYYADYKDEVDRDLKEHLDAQENYKRVLEKRQVQARRRAARA